MHRRTRQITKRRTLVETVNNLKDILHIHGVHFIVSVSIDALKSFQQRGMPDRDVFDSSFDNIVNLGCLTIDESVDIVTSRAVGFPAELAYYLPRLVGRASTRSPSSRPAVVWTCSAIRTGTRSCLQRNSLKR